MEGKHEWQVSMILHWPQNLSTSVAIININLTFFSWRFTLFLRSVYRDTLVSVTLPGFDLGTSILESLGLHGYPTRQIWGIWKLRPAYSPETPNLGQNRWCFVPCDLEIWWMTLENNRASLLCCFKLCATFHSHWWIQTGVTVRKRPNLGQIRRFLEQCDLEIWRMTLKNNRAPFLCYFKLCASFRSHWWIQTGVTVRKRPI